MKTERRALQVAVVIAGLVPVTAGALGALRPELLDLAGPPHALTHLSYLSGLLLGIGLCFWSLVPGIERQSRAFSLLAAIVVVGGLARGAAALRLGTAPPLGAPAAGDGTGRHAPSMALAETRGWVFQFRAGMTIFRF